MQVTAWRTQTENKKEFNYRLQVDGIKGKRAKNRILKCVREWSSAGEGVSGNRKEFIMIFSRTFDTPKAWLRWAKDFPYNLVELKRDGTPKPIKRRIRV
tara:strand:+ start:1433 stop:1729 length:297 start_codon:yes stop_codon:yes gene_type:complete